MAKKIKKKGMRTSVSLFSSSYKPWWSFQEERQEMISPYMGIIDSNRLYNRIRPGLEDIINDTYHRAGGIKALQISEEEFMRRALNMVPQHMVADIYNLYYTSSEDHEYATVDSSNSGKWNLLKNVNDSSLKVVTNSSNINSTIFTTEICNAIMRALLRSLSSDDQRAMSSCMKGVKAKQEEDGESEQSGDGNSEPQDGNEPQAGDSRDGEGDSKDEGKEGLSAESADKDGDKSEGKSERDKPSKEHNDDNKSAKGASKGTGTVKKPEHNIAPTPFEKLVDKAASNLNYELDMAKAAALKRISDIEELGIDIKDLEERNGKESALSMLTNIDEVIEKAKQVSIKSKGLKSILERIIDKSLSYFSKTYKSKELSIFDSDNIDEIDGIENFHSKLFKYNMEEIVTRENVYKGKINIYVDVSSSMNSNCTFDGNSMDTMLFAKSLILKLMSMDMVHRVIPFGSNLKKAIENPKMADILMLNAHCGTVIDNVVTDCEKRMENGLVITDCQDNIYKGSNYCFFLGTPGARFTLKTEQSQEMSDNKQLWVFTKNGDDIITC